MDRFDLMYGVTESEKFHILSPIALLHGMVDVQRDEVLREHAKVRSRIVSRLFAHFLDCQLKLLLIATYIWEEKLMYRRGTEFRMGMFAR